MIIGQIDPEPVVVDVADESSGVVLAAGVVPVCV